MARILQINTDLFLGANEIREHPRLSARFAFMIIVQVWLRICFAQSTQRNAQSAQITASCNRLPQPPTATLRPFDGAQDKLTQGDAFYFPTNLLTSPQFTTFQKFSM